jgi:HD-GYP domain-containing protein (c-di-GMP phosphodiesterase class II)
MAMNSRLETGSKSDPAKRTGNFIPVRVELLKPDSPLDFALYIEGRETGRVLFLEPGQQLTRSVQSRLEKEQARLFIHRSAVNKYRNHQESHLRDLLIRSDKVDDFHVAALAYDLSLTVMEAAFQRPDPASISQAGESLQTTVDLIMDRDQAIFHLLKTISSSPELHVHSCNTAIMGLGLAKSLIAQGVEINIHALAPALFFHDLGHTLAAKENQDRPEPLTPAQWTLMEEHLTAGLDLLTKAGLVNEEVEAVVRQHHERLDGSGFPLHLKDEEISLWARICAIADVYDVLTSDRPDYQRRSGLAAAQYMMKDLTGRFDQTLLRRFFTLFKHVG